MFIARQLRERRGPRGLAGPGQRLRRGGQEAATLDASEHEEAGHGETWEERLHSPAHPNTGTRVPQIVSRS